MTEGYDSDRPRLSATAEVEVACGAGRSGESVSLGWNPSRQGSSRQRYARTFSEVLTGTGFARMSLTGEVSCTYWHSFSSSSGDAFFALARPVTRISVKPGLGPSPMPTKLR